MSKAQEIFNRMEETKREQREIKAMYRDALANSGRYQDLVDEIKGLKEKKKQVEDGVKSDFKGEFDKLENLKADIQNDNQLLSDVIMSQVARGEKIEITDKNEVQYEPIFSVRFRKSN